MRILIDTNVLISAMIWKNSRPAAALLHAADHNEIIVCEQNLYELRTIVEKKFAKYKAHIDLFLASFAYELVPSLEDAGQLIRDAKDQPILNAAIVNGADIILTGDKDFLSLGLEYPQCLTVVEYLERYAEE